MPSDNAHGLLIVDKPRGPSSHTVVQQARRLYRTTRVGHAGTLDPDATGVLVLLFGEATKLCEHLTGADKSYEATVDFTRSTDTLDGAGATIEEAEALGAIDLTRLSEAVAEERARISQVPPAVSAIKVNGHRAYRLTRQGAPPTLEPRPVRVSALELLESGPTEATLRMTVSKGYYVRSLARDLGSRIGRPAHLTSLRRIRSGSFDLAKAYAWPPQERPALTPLASVLRDTLPTATLTAGGEHKARCGLRLWVSDFAVPPPTGRVSAWFGPSGCVVALGEGEPLDSDSLDSEAPGSGTAVFQVRRGINDRTTDFP